jgi:hypothetical protein
VFRLAVRVFPGLVGAEVALVGVLFVLSFLATTRLVSVVVTGCQRAGSAGSHPGNRRRTATIGAPRNGATSGIFSSTDKVKSPSSAK